jgi:hypothetical protein
VSSAQVQNTTVPYLRAAIGSLSIGERVTFSATYDGKTGLHEADGRYLKNKGYSRFAVTDAESGAAFKSVYCLQNSKVFAELMAVNGSAAFVFSGYKDRGESKEDAVIVTQIVPIGDNTQRDARAAADAPASFRVTLTDLSTSNSTVLVNIATGQTYRVLNTEIRIDQDRQP